MDAITLLDEIEMWLEGLIADPVALAVYRAESVEIEAAFDVSMSEW